MSAYTRRDLRVDCKRPYAREMRRFVCAFRLRTYGVRSVNPALSPFSMERFLKRFRRRLCPRLIRARQGLPGEEKTRTKSATTPLQNTLHGKRALYMDFCKTTFDTVPHHRLLVKLEGAIDGYCAAVD